MPDHGVRGAVQGLLISLGRILNDKKTRCKQIFLPPSFTTSIDIKEQSRLKTSLRLRAL